MLAPGGLSQFCSAPLNHDDGILPKELSFRIAACRARNLLLRCWQQTDSSPMELASECQKAGLFFRQTAPLPSVECTEARSGAYDTIRLAECSRLIFELMNVCPQGGGVLHPLFPSPF